MKKNFFAMAMRRVSLNLTSDGAWLAIALAIASVPITQFLNHYRFIYNDVQKETENALFSTKQQLSETFWQLAADPKLKATATDNQNYSLKQSLANSLSSGKVDAIAFYDADCRVLAVSSIKASKLVPCRKEHEGFIWMNEEDKSGQLALLQKMQTEGAPTFLVALQVRTGADWLMQFPNLAHLFKAYQFSLKPNIANGLEAAPELRSEQWYFKHFARYAQGRNEVRNFFFWPFVLLALFFALIEGISRQLKWQYRRELLAQFSAWCNDLSLPYPENFTVQSLDSELVSYFSKLSKIIGIKTKQTVLDLARSEAYAKEVEAVNQKLKEQVIKLERKYQAGVLHESLALQVQQVALPLSERLYNADDQLHVIIQLLQKQLLVHSNSLFEHLFTWKKGIAEKGARKFIRSLYEQSSEQAEKDQLTVALDRFLLLCSKIGDAAIQSCLQVKKIQPTYAVGAKTLAKWYSLALSDRLDLNKKAMILDSLKTVKGMLEAAGIVVRWKLLQPESLIREMPLPEGVLISALYHILGEFLQNSDGSPVVIELKLEGASRWLYFWHPHLASGEWEAKNRVLSLVRHLIEGHGLSIQYINQPKAQMLFISWNENVTHSSENWGPNALPPKPEARVPGSATAN